MVGASAGLGGMSDKFGDIDCEGCDSFAGQGEFHIGGFIGPRLALLGELQANTQTLSSSTFGGTEYLTQFGVMLAAQYWVTPQLWVKGGVGLAYLQIDWSAYSDGFIDDSSAPERGFALMGAIGYELLSARNFSIDLQGRLLNGSYEGIDNHVTAGSIGIGVNWY